MNKTFLMLFAFVLASAVVHAQTSQGNMMAGGEITFGSASRQGGSFNDYSSFSFSPSFGYFVSDNLAVGASITLTTWREGTGSAKTTGNGFGFGPFVRYYKFTSNERFAIFGQAGVNVETGKTDPPVGDVIKSNAVSFAVFPGASYFLTDHWAVEVSITGLVVRSEDPDTNNDNDKWTTVDLSIRSFSPALGLRYHF